jgi:hypothetical protein
MQPNYRGIASVPSRLPSRGWQQLQPLQAKTVFRVTVVLDFEHLFALHCSIMAEDAMQIDELDSPAEELQHALTCLYGATSSAIGIYTAHFEHAQGRDIYGDQVVDGLFVKFHEIERTTKLFAQTPRELQCEQLQRHAPSLRTHAAAAKDLVEPKLEQLQRLPTSIEMAMAQLSGSDAQSEKCDQCVPLHKVLHWVRQMTLAIDAAIPISQKIAVAEVRQETVFVQSAPLYAAHTEFSRE